jgi:cation diffusion facilitator CzcD-associated flavoprotein CzcO
MQHAHSKQSKKSPRIVIIGTGFAGLCMGIRLKQAGIDSFTIFEQAAELGGTWRDNDYPGASCDVQSHVYSFSFEKNPRWSRMFAEQREIRAYMNHCADKYAIRSHIRFNCTVTAARFDETTGTWTVTLGSGAQVQADIVATATVGLSRPSYPDILGLSSFEGTLFHSARWNHEYELEGKAVGVIGTGASSIQFLPQIAPRVKQLHLFQRTPPWIVPKPDRVIGRFEQWLYRVLPALQWFHRIALYWLFETRVLGFVINPKLMQYPRRAALEYLRQSVSDSALRSKLTPSYSFGCKRVLISNDYFPALQRENVELVTDGIREVTRDGIITIDGKHRKLDALILGTGFHASESVAPFTVRGLDGLDLGEHWRDGAEAFLGTTIAGFPNLFMIVGPNTGLGHTSIIFMIEAQVEHVMRAIAALQSQGTQWIEVRKDVQRRFNRRIQAALSRSVWASGCTSWYTTRTGKNTTLWPGFTFVFRRLARRFDTAHYTFASPVSREEPASIAPRAAAITDSRSLPAKLD